jgi:hypothetical protein
MQVKMNCTVNPASKETLSDAMQKVNQALNWQLT